MNKAALIVFQKNAVLGKVKTRLAASVGDEKALKIYEWLTAYTHQQVKELRVDKYLFYSDFIPENSTKDLEKYQFEVQSGKDLGERMRNAFSKLFTLGYTSVIILGTDCADLKTEYLNKAFMSLSQSEIVLGPAKDGGYYLLGMSRYIPEIFQDIPWSTSKVLEATLDRANALKIEYEFLTVLSDIDNLKDWEHYTNRNKIIYE